MRLNDDGTNAFTGKPLIKPAPGKSPVGGGEAKPSYLETPSVNGQEPVIKPRPELPTDLGGTGLHERPQIKPVEIAPIQSQPPEQIIDQPAPVQNPIKIPTQSPLEVNKPIAPVQRKVSIPFGEGKAKGGEGVPPTAPITDGIPVPPPVISAPPPIQPPVTLPPSLPQISSIPEPIFNPPMIPPAPKPDEPKPKLTAPPIAITEPIEPTPMLIPPKTKIGEPVKETMIVNPHQGIGEPANETLKVDPTKQPAPEPPAKSALKNFGEYLDKILAMPSSYDDKAMQQLSESMQKKLAQTRDEELAAADADAASRGIFWGGSGGIVNRDKAREKYNQGLSDFNSALAMDRAQRFGADRQNAIDSAFKYLAGAQDEDQLQAYLAQVAGQLGFSGAPQFGSTELPDATMGEMDPNLFAMLGSLFGGGGNKPTTTGGKTQPPTQKGKKSGVFSF